MKTGISKIIAILFTICVVTSITAQKFGDISMELLQQEVHPLDSTAHAAYIHKNVEIEYDFKTPGKTFIVMDYHYKIKVYDDEGESYASFSIPTYRDGGKKESVYNIRGVTVNLENGEAVKTKMNKKDVFEVETSDNYKTKKFALPNVKAGSVIELKFTFKTPYIYSIPKWYFQHYVPTDYSKYEIKIPSYFILTPIPSGAHPLNMESEEMNISDHGEMKHTLVAENVKAFKSDKFVLNDNDYRSGIKYELKSIKFPRQSIQHLSESWDQIAIRLNQAKYFGSQFKKKIGVAEEALNEAKALPIEERKEFIYDYVKTNFTWNKKYGIGSYDGLKKFTKNGSGNVGDMNLLLLNLLRKCEIECYPLVMKSRRSGVLNTHFPSLTELDYTLVYVPNGESYELLDATSKYTPIGQLPVRTNNLYGVIIYEDRGQIIELESPNIYRIDSASDYVYDVENNKLTGTTTRKRKNYGATKYRIDLEESEEDEENQEDEDDVDADDENEDEEEDEGEQEDDYEDFNVDNIYTLEDIKNLNDLSQPILLTIKEELVSNSKAVGDKIFFDATLDFGVKKNPFDEETRDYPIFYNSNVYLRTYATIKIPEGYTIEKLPEPAGVSLPEKKGIFKYNAVEQQGKIAINYQFKINDTFYSPLDYPTLKKFYEIMVEKSKEKIVLVKT